PDLSRLRESPSPPLAPLGWTRVSAPRLRRGPRRGGGALRASAHRAGVTLRTLTYRASAHRVRGCVTTAGLPVLLPAHRERLVHRLYSDAVDTGPRPALDRDRIEAALNPPWTVIEIVDVTESTNADLIATAETVATGTVLVAEFQRRGRG